MFSTLKLFKSTLFQRWSMLNWRCFKVVCRLGCKLLSPRWGSEGRLLCFRWIFDVCAVRCGLFTHPIGVIGRLCYLITFHPEHHFTHYENTPIQIYWKFYHQKMAIFQIKKSDIFHMSAQNIDCGYSLEPPRRGGSNQYPQSMFLSRNKKNNVYPCKPQFYYIKVVKGGQNYIGMFSWCTFFHV